MSDEHQPSEVNVVLGDHLRKLRKQKGLSLLDVQALSHGEFKASVMGAYERGERAISALRLSKLATLYRLPLQAMLPAGEASETVGGGLAIDMARLESSKGAEAATLARFVRRLQSLRQDPTGGVVRIRAEDIVALASACDRTPAEFVKLLDDQGLRAY
jgi:transcriptional regulator with XRE-family HTH domain